MEENECEHLECSEMSGKVEILFTIPMIPFSDQHIEKPFRST